MQTAFSFGASTPQQDVSLRDSNILVSMVDVRIHFEGQRVYSQTILLLQNYMNCYMTLVHRGRTRLLLRQ